MKSIQIKQGQQSSYVNYSAQIIPVTAEKTYIMDQMSRGTDTLNGNQIG